MKKNIHIVLLGDSLTARGDWKNDLLKENLVNLGIDGDTTKGVLNRVDSAIDLEPNILFLMIGINDLCTSIPLKDVFESYKKIVLKFENTNIKLIVQAIILTQMNPVNKKIIEFNHLLKEYCDSKGLIFFDINPKLSQNGFLKETYTTDGLHLNLKAYKVWAQEIKGNTFFS